MGESLQKQVSQTIYLIQNLN